MIVLGRIVGPFGIQGWVKVHPFGDDPLDWRKIREWHIAADPEAGDADWKPLKLRTLKAHGKGLIASFVELPDRNAAEAVDGFYLGAAREAMPAPGVDEYYWGDLVGLAVVNQAGVCLGKVNGLMSTGAHDVLQVQDGDLERLIPFVGAYIKDVDLAAAKLTVEWEADW
ncbi:MAG: ribosome maturation factor RimM [Betaproteobacteria bacterium]|nr:ribosome maturation factor RimM [Betaproteobacteria bacterium]